MKIKLNVLKTLAGIALVTILSACSKKDIPSTTEVNTEIVSAHAWKLQSLKVDNADKTSLYAGMTLSFTSTTFTTTNGAPVWPVSGTWSFVGDDGIIIKRDDQTEVAVDQISDDQLVLSLTWSKNTFGGGRISSVKGKHVYTFIK